MTVQEVFDTLSELQKKKVYYIVGLVADGLIADLNIIDLSFLSNCDQVEVVKEIIKKVDDTYCRAYLNERRRRRMND